MVFFLPSTDHFRSSPWQNRVGIWQYGSSGFCCHGGSSLNYTSTTCYADFAPTVESRREFFRATARYGLLALVSVAAAWRRDRERPAGSAA